MGSFRRNLLLTPLFLVFLLPCFTGCGTFFYFKEGPEHKALRNEGYDLCHLDSCGPEALSHILKSLGLSKSAHQIGRDIQDMGGIPYRGLLSVISHKFYRITCPPDLFNYCESLGIKAQKVPYGSLEEGDVGIILLRGANFIGDWHWIEWPQKRATIETFFEEDTKIISSYILTRESDN